MKELQEKSDTELLRLLAELRSKLQDGRFAAIGRSLTRVRELCDARKDVARILTIMNERTSQKLQEPAQAAAGKTSSEA